MRSILILMILFFFAPTAHGDDHTHAGSSPEANSEADRLMAMFYEAECNDDEAKIWYKRSLAHFPKNTLSRVYLKQMPHLLKEESRKWATLARKTHDPQNYIRALRCDLTNFALWDEYAQVLHAQNYLKYLDINK